MQLEMIPAQNPEPTLRPYQQRAVDLLYQWFVDGNKGNPCIVMPTGSGKSHIIAHICKDAIQKWPETRVMMLTHVRELISQNLDKLLAHWPDAPVGIYSAGMKRKELGHEITFAGIQSIYKRADDVGHIDLIFIDEAHLCSHDDVGMYRTFINHLTLINPQLRVIGLTATPYRLGHGMITDKPAIFDALIEPVSIEELVYKKYLAPLRSKVTLKKLDVEGVHRRGGEYIESELQAAVNTVTNNKHIAEEIKLRAGDKKAWLVFCSGVDHAQAFAAELIERGVAAACITGETPAGERDRMLAEFKSGKIRAMVNVNVLTTGFDYPDIDLIAMLRPTLSPGLYLQQAGRGMRVKSHTDHCLVLDFAGNVAMHGPITCVRPPDKAKHGEAVSKVCSNCGEICAGGCSTCPACGFVFPKKEREAKSLDLHDDDIMGNDNRVREMQLEGWAWRTHVGKSSNKEMLLVKYYSEHLSDPIIKEHLCIEHGGYAQERAMRTLFVIATKAKVVSELQHDDLSLNDIADIMNGADPPTSIKYKADGKFYRVLERTWQQVDSKDGE
jgi:DNA repair protein RadD